MYLDQHLVRPRRRLRHLADARRLHRTELTNHYCAHRACPTEIAYPSGTTDSAIETGLDAARGLPSPALLHDGKGNLEAQSLQLLPWPGLDAPRHSGMLRLWRSRRIS